MHPNAQQRHQVLEILYHALATKPRSGWVNVRTLDKLGEVEFGLICLKELGHARQDGFNWRITGAGILAYEAACAD
jgi:hypothetical protein